MIKTNILYYLLCIICMAFSIACRKNDFLDKKPSTDIVTPATLEDFQALLDNDAIINEMPVLGEVSADNYYLTYNFWQSITGRERYAHVWAQDIYQGQTNIPDWNLSYQQVFYANVVLENLPKVEVTAGNSQQWDAMKGSALFTRGQAFYNVAQLFAPVFDEATAAADPGIPLRLTPGVDEVSVRASVEKTYQQIITDLKEAARLLPTPIAVNNRNRPCRPAAFALLARVYLSMREYSKAALYADSCLQLYPVLYDYNTIPNIASPFPFTKTNVEIMYQARLFLGTAIIKGVTVVNCIVDSTLFRSYSIDDLRRSAFYGTNGAGLPIAKGSYTGSTYAFGGIATDEVYLIRAEGMARTGNIAAAMNDINALLRTRWKTASAFIPYTAATQTDAVNIVLTERRKELPFRGLRWTDLRRLNKEGANIVPTRALNNQQYSLPVGDKRYVLPIPPDVIALSGMQQNPR
jgi:starch-binding outer membrane protein, SusD/RagB family